MKHLLRSEKKCLNCGAKVPERYCSHCGQENLEPKESVGHLISHFFNDLTHYDSKFFLSIKYLFIKPGFLTKEYVQGRRASYLNPIRMYIFISFVFFLIYFLIVSHENHRGLLGMRDTQDTMRIGTVNIVGFGGGDKYTTLKAYDSIQQTLAEKDKDIAISRVSIRHYLQMKEKYGERTSEVFMEKVMHNIPKVMFLFLPLFALFLKWMYDRKKYVYVNHAIFSLHFHSIIFLVYLIFAIAGLFFPISYWIANIGLLIYLVLALRNAYEQTYVRSFFKGLFLAVVYFIIVFIGVETLALTTFFLT